MSAIAGIVHLDGGEGGVRDQDELLLAMRHWGPVVWTVAASGGCLAHLGSQNSHLPSRLPGGEIVSVAARLDNRDQLLDLLQVEHQEQLTLSDAGLTARAFERWGEACPLRLNGDWSLAVWSPAKKRLFLARDHYGNTCLYHARCGGRVAFASDIKALLSLPWLPKRLDEPHLASLLVGGGIERLSSTVYRDISRVPPAHTVSVDLGAERVVRYWRVEDTPDAGPSRSADRVEKLRETLRAAVSSRLRPDETVGSMLSGGLDSGAVTALAAENLSRCGRRLTAFTSVPAFPVSAAARAAGCIDEGPRAAALARAFDSIDHVLVPARSVGPVTGIRRALTILGEPAIAAASCGWITEIMADAQARGIKVLLTGQVGDFVMAGRPLKSSWRRDLAARRFRPALKQFAPGWLLRLRYAEWKPWRLSEPPWRPFSVVNAEFAAETNIAERLRAEAHDPKHSRVRLATSHVGAIWAPLGASFGMTVVDPLQDKRVMEEMFSGPRPTEAGASDRWLFRQSLVGVLPEDVRLNRGKGIQGADIIERLEASWGEVEDALAQAEASPFARRCIDLRYCRELAGTLRSPRAPYQARLRASMLLDGIAAAVFLAETW